MAKGKHPPAPGAIRKDKVIHPNSRKAARMKAKVHKRQLQGSKVAAQGGGKLQALGEKLSWFRDALEICLDEESRASAALVLRLAEAYLSRFDEELEQVRLVASIGKKSRGCRYRARTDALEHAAKMEAEEFGGCGLEMPDLTDQANLEYFKGWQGELRLVQNIKLKRFTRKALEKAMDDEVEQRDKRAKEAEMDTS